MQTSLPDRDLTRIDPRRLDRHQDSSRASDRILDLTHRQDVDAVIFIETHSLHVISSVIALYTTIPIPDTRSRHRVMGLRFVKNTLNYGRRSATTPTSATRKAIRAAW